MLIRFTLLWLVALAGGCARTYHWAYQYEPRPVTLSITSAPASESQPVLLTATVIGVRTPSAKEQPATVEVRMRLENQSSATASAIGGPMELRSADLKTFGAAVFSPAEALQVRPGEASQFTAYFPLSTGKVPGGHDLEGLSLQWTVGLADARFTRTFTFSRRPPRGYYDDPGPRFGFGVHYHFFQHHHHHRHRRR
jgi:hypothetical protein